MFHGLASVVGIQFFVTDYRVLEFLAVVVKERNNIISCQALHKCNKICQYLHAYSNITAVLSADNNSDLHI